MFESTGANIVKTPDVCFGRPRISGTRTRVQDIAIFHNAGWNVDKIADELDLTPGQVYAALSYYSDHKEEIDRAIGSADAKVMDLIHQGRGLTTDEFQRRVEARRRDATQEDPSDG